MGSIGNKAVDTGDFLKKFYDAEKKSGTFALGESSGEEAVKGAGRRWRSRIRTRDV